jgi:hypothetical protein
MATQNDDDSPELQGSLKTKGTKTSMEE